MSNRVRVLGVHPVEAEEPVHLAEVEVIGRIEDFDFGEVTQEVAGQPRSNWQAVYDERELARTDASARFAFFFHYLGLAKPLLTPFGGIGLPGPSPIPVHLKGIEYEQP
jgi:hypothetical protein